MIDFAKAEKIYFRLLLLVIFVVVGGAGPCGRSEKGDFIEEVFHK